ncbi:hypothetical protein ALP53_200032 [Pseudomonas savastanoi pv. phaseolicola]|nr:hypothetical protein ALP53_200032 [Pseudomonas savastanoi pv. phaseolicola]
MLEFLFHTNYAFIDAIIINFLNILKLRRFSTDNALNLGHKLVGNLKGFIIRLAILKSYAAFCSFPINGPAIGIKVTDRVPNALST